MLHRLKGKVNLDSVVVTPTLPGRLKRFTDAGHKDELKNGSAAQKSGATKDEAQESRCQHAFVGRCNGAAGGPRMCANSALTLHLKEGP